MRVTSLLAVLSVFTVACQGAGDDDGLALAASAVAPPQSTLDLTMDPLAPGYQVNVVVTGAAPGATVDLIRSTTGAGAGDCFPFLGGNCMDILAPYTPTLAGTANASGVVSWVVPSFPTLPAGDVWFQAVVRAGTSSNESNVVYNPTLAECAADATEPNDTPPGVSLSDGTTSGLTLCSGDADWYTVRVLPNETVEVTASFDHAGEGDLNLEMYDGPGSPLDVSYGSGDSETVSITNRGTASTIVAVHPFIFEDTTSTGGSAGGPGIPYELDVSRVVAAPCLADGAEPNDDSSAAGALTAGPYPGLTSCLGDDDWYVVSTVVGNSLSAFVDYDPAEGGLEIAAFNGNPLAQIDTDRGVPVEVSSGSAATTNEDIYFRVRALSDDPAGGGVPYTLDIFDDVTPPCAPDAYEPNDTLQTAVALPAVPVDLTACDSGAGTASDYFSFQATAGQQIVVNASFFAREGDIDIRLYGPLANVVGSSAGTGDSETITFTATRTGTHTVWVQLFRDASVRETGNSYTLDVSVN